MRSLRLAAVLSLTAACATTPPPPKMSAEEAFAPAEVTPVSAARSRGALGTPKAWASQFRRDLDCEHNAHALVRHHGNDVAWAYVKECASRTGFSQLEAMVQHWESDLKTRAEAPAMIAAMLAARGGHLRADLELLQLRRIPMFDLNSALRQAPAFKGRYLVFVGKIAEAKERKGVTELVVLEQALASEASSVMSGPRYGSVSSSSGQGALAWRSNGAVGSGAASGRYSRRSSTQSGTVETRITDTFEETGQEIIARLKQPDPFLTVDKNLVFLVRFDGTLVVDTESTAEGEEPHRTALVTLISYHDL